MHKRHQHARAIRSAVCARFLSGVPHARNGGWTLRPAGWFRARARNPTGRRVRGLTRCSGHHAWNAVWTAAAATKRRSAMRLWLWRTKRVRPSVPMLFESACPGGVCFWCRWRTGIPRKTGFAFGRLLKLWSWKYPAWSAVAVRGNRARPVGAETGQWSLVMLPLAPPGCPITKKRVVLFGSSSLDALRQTGIESVDFRRRASGDGGEPYRRPIRQPALRLRHCWTR